MTTSSYPGQAGPTGVSQGPPAGTHLPAAEESAATSSSRRSLTTAGLGVIGAAFALLAGAWLMYAPFALGYQNDFGSWNDATKTDFWDGFGLAIVALVALGVTLNGLITELRRVGVVTSRRSSAAPAATAPAPAPGTVSGEELTALLRPLLEALKRDNAEAPNGVRTGTGSVTGTVTSTGPYAEELAAHRHQAGFGPATPTDR